MAVITAIIPFLRSCRGGRYENARRYNIVASCRRRQRGGAVFSSSYRVSANKKQEMSDVVDRGRAQSRKLI